MPFEFEKVKKKPRYKKPKLFLYSITTSCCLSNNLLYCHFYVKIYKNVQCVNF